MTDLRAAFEAKYSRSADDPASAEMLTIWEDAWNAATERAAKQVPMQPVGVADDGVVRFKANRIIGALYREAANHGLDMNGIARGDFTKEERMQFAQLIGYSVSGYGQLSYVSDESYDDAEQRAAFIRRDATGNAGGGEGGT